MNQILFKKVKRLIVKQFNVDANLVTEEANFRETLVADSLDLIELSMAVSRYLGSREIVDEEMRQIETVGELVSYLEGHPREQNGRLNSM